MPRRQLTPRGIERDREHGVLAAAEMMDTHGEEAAIAWFHEHEQLPLHSNDLCPLVPDERGQAARAS